MQFLNINQTNQTNILYYFKMGFYIILMIVNIIVVILLYLLLFNYCTFSGLPVSIVEFNIVLLVSSPDELDASLSLPFLHCSLQNFQSLGALSC